MNELIFIFFLLSGVIKPFLMYYHIPTGIDFTLFTAILLIGLLLKNIINNNFTFKLTHLSKYAITLILMLFTLILFSFFYSSSQDYIYTKTFQLFTILLGFFFPLLTQKFSIEKFFKYFILTVIILTIIFLPLFLAGYKLLISNYTSYLNSPLFSMYQSYLPMGYVIAIALIINSFTLVIKSPFRLIISIILFSILIITGARGPLFSLLLIYFLFLLSGKFTLKTPRLKYLIPFVLLISITGGYALTKINIADSLERTYRRITTIEQDTSANQRLVYARFVLDYMDADHILFGYGFGSFGFEKSHLDQREYPHNMALEILFELGVVGLMIYGLFILVIIHKLTKYKNFMAWVIFLFLLLNSFKSLSLSDSRIFFGFMSILLIFNSYLQTLKQTTITNNAEGKI